MFPVHDDHDTVFINYFFWQLVIMSIYMRSRCTNIQYSYDDHVACTYFVCVHQYVILSDNANSLY